MASLKCEACGFEAQQPTKFCIKCGAPTPTEASAAPLAPPSPVPSADASAPAATTPSVSVTIEPPATPAANPKPAAPGAPAPAPAPAAGGFGSVTVTINPPPPPPPPPPPMGIRPPAAQPAAGGATVTVTTNPPAKSGSSKGLIIGVAVAAVVAIGAFMSMGKSSDTTATKAPQSSSASAPTAPAAAPVVLSAKDHLNQLLGLARDGRWKDVPAKVSLVKSMGQVNKTNDATSKTLTDQGYEQLGADQLAKAAETFEKAIQADPGNHQARFGLGSALTRQAKFDAAITVLIDSLLIAPDAGSGWLTAAEAFSELGKTEAATSALKLAYYLANNRDNARKFLEDPSRIKSEKFRKVIESTLPALSGIPAKS